MKVLLGAEEMPLYSHDSMGKEAPKLNLHFYPLKMFFLTIIEELNSNMLSLKFQAQMKDIWGTLKVYYSIRNSYVKKGPEEMGIRQAGPQLSKGEKNTREQ